jgi:membrane-associated phospholipid phosphatase
MLRFFISKSLCLVCVLQFFSYSAFAVSEDSDGFTFSEKHIDPVLKKGTDLHSGLALVTGGLAAWGTRANDDEYRAKWVNYQQMSKKDARLGDYIGTGAASLLVMGTQFLAEEDSTNFQSHARGFIYGGLAIYTLKTAFGRNRPGASDSHQSFPSGHTAISFMTATHLTYAYGWPAAVLAYPIAAFTGASRLADDVHWFSDTVGGAFLGYYIGRATFYDQSYIEEVKEKNNVRYDFIPLFQPQQSGFQLLVSY